MSRSDAAAAALDYLARGWAVVPIHPAEKRPLVRWDAYQNAPPGESEVRAWYARWPEAGVGIVTGGVSGLVVLDVDPEHGGKATLASLTAEHGPLPATAEAATGGGGRHLYFQAPEKPLRSRVGLRPGLDLRAEGGLVVAPPSRHPSGRRYAWRRGRTPDETPPAALPGWLDGLVRGRPQGRGHPAWYWRDLLRRGVEEGERNATIASLTGHLLWHGVDPEAITELLLCWNRVRCRPPLSDEEVARTVESIRRTHARPGDGDGP